MINIPNLTSAIKQAAHQLGFSLVGITSPDPPDHIEFYKDWCRRGYHGTMGWMAAERALTRRADPLEILPECRSILVLGADYPAPLHPQKTGGIAAYAWGGTDYHNLLGEKLELLVEEIETLAGKSVPNRWYTDTGPILERELGMRAGLGWIGKNTCLIDPQRGSFFFLAEILLGMELELDAPFSKTLCGNCTRCLDACPTGCLTEPYTLDASRCISYLTIEYRGLIPEPYRKLMGEWIFGCDICQQVCPWNQRFSHRQSVMPAFQPSPTHTDLDLVSEVSLTIEQFTDKFRGSPVKRTKRRGYIRNAAVALGNQGRQAAVPALQSALQDPEMLVRSHAAWALGEIGGQQAQSALKDSLAEEQDPDVIQEMRRALKKIPPFDN